MYSIQDNSELLMDTLVDLLSNVIGFCHKNKILIEDETSINLMLRQTRKILQSSSHYDIIAQI